jgi:dipeptidase E
MKFYLSSYKLGEEVDQFKEMMPPGKKLGYIPNALDYSGANPQRRKQGIQEGMDELRNLGFDVELIDLKNYFGRNKELKRKLNQLGGVFVRGGNTFVLRQAMKLSGFDEILKEMKRDDFLYSGYSAGICVLAPDLHSLQIVDDSNDTPYERLKKVIFEGLGILDYIILPHYKSDHPESADIDKEVEYCKEHNVKFRTLRDGEVIIIK